MCVLQPFNGTKFGGGEGWDMRKGVKRCKGKSFQGKRTTRLRNQCACTISTLYACWLFQSVLDVFFVLSRQLALSLSSLERAREYSRLNGVEQDIHGFHPVIVENPTFMSC
jgi:hypothetical protein